MLPARPIYLRWWLGVLVAGVALPLILLLIWLYGSQVQRERRDARELALRLAKGTAARLNVLHRDSRLLLAQLSARPAIRSFSHTPCDSLFAIIDFFPQYADLFFFDGHGALICEAVPQAEDRRVSAGARLWIESELRQGRLRPGEPMIRPIDSRWVSALSASVLSADGASRGTLVLVQLPEALVSEALPKGSVVTILDRNGTIVARAGGSGKWTGRNVRGIGVTEIAMRQEEGVAQARGVDGVLRQYGFVHMPEIGWYVYVGIPTSVVMEPVRQMLVRGVEGGVVIVLAVIVIAAILSRGVERPVRILVGTAEQRMLDDERKLKALSDRLLVVQEEERSRIARELHDDLGQSLTALKMDVIGLLEKTQQQSGSPIADRILRTLDATVTSVQRISSELRPSILDDLGLVAAIESESRLFEERTGIECELSLAADARIEPHCATAIYRIVQEALTNVARHSNASRVEIRLRQRSEELLLEIRDDGRGVTDDEVTNPLSLGLVGIRERADLIGGTVQFEGVAGRGTIVSVRIPVSTCVRSTT
jgi:signal transduction histidine kinase